MIEIGRVCVKTAGRDAGQIAVIVDILDDKFVIIDGNVRRRKCNVAHLEPTDKVLKIAKKADTRAIHGLMTKEKLGITKNAETKKKAATAKPVKKRVAKKTENPKAVKKKAVKKK